MIRTDRGMLDSRVLIASSVPHPECAGRDLADIAAEHGARPGRGERAGCSRAARSTSRWTRPTCAHHGLRRDDDRLRRHPARRQTAPAPVGDLPARARPLLPRARPLPARNRGVEDDGADRPQLRPRRPRHARPGAHADVVVFDAASVRDLADYEHPTQASAGIAAVLVNGAITWQQGRHLGTRNGQVITRDTTNSARGARQS